MLRSCPHQLEDKVVIDTFCVVRACVCSDNCQIVSEFTFHCSTGVCHLCCSGEQGSVVCQERVSGVLSHVPSPLYTPL